MYDAQENIILLQQIHYSETDTNISLIFVPILSRFDKTIGIPKDSKQLKTELKKKERKKAKTFL